MGKGLARLALVVSLMVGASVGCGSSDVDDESAGSAQTATSTTSVDDEVAASDCEELSTLAVGAQQDLFDLIEGYTLDELYDGMGSEHDEALAERFSALEHRAFELECATTTDRAALVLLCPGVSQFRVSGEAAEDFYAQLLNACADPESRDLDVVSADVWAEQVCDILDPFWLTIDDAWGIRTPQIDEPRDTVDGLQLLTVDELQLIDAWLIELAEVTERTVVDLTATGAPDVDEGSAMATALIITQEEIATSARAAHAALPDTDEGDADYSIAAEPMFAAASHTRVFSARWGELFDELMAGCDVAP